MTESDNIVFCKGWDIVAFTDGGPIFIHPYSIEDVPTISIRRTETGFRLGFNTNHKVRVDPVALGLDGPVFTDRITLSSYDGVLKATAERNRVDALKAEEKLRRESDESHARWLERHPTCWKCHLAQNIWIPSQNRMGKWCKRQDKLVEDGPLCEWAQEQGGRRTGGI